MKQAQHICMHSEDHEKMILVYDRSSNGRDQQGVEQCASVYKGRVGQDRVFIAPVLLRSAVQLHRPKKVALMGRQE